MASADSDFNDKPAPSASDIGSFIRAAEQGDRKRVEEYLARFGSDFAKTDDQGTTPLMLAAFRDQLAVMSLLIDNGADIEAKNRDGDTALIWALYGERPDAALLLDNGASVNVTNKMGKTPFDYAEKLSRPDIVAQMKTATPRYIEKTVERGIQGPLPVRKPLKLRRK